MIRGFYTSLSAIIAGLDRQSVVADNIANLSTIGFKGSQTTQASFELELLRSTGGQLGRLAVGTYMTGPMIDRSQGTLVDTGVPTDLAIEGDGLFVVRTSGGIAYTRAGDFVVDASGTLTTQAGHPVLDTAGREVRVAGELQVGPDGSVAGSGQRLALVGWPASGMVRLGGTEFASPGPLPAATGTVRQGALEQSNVDLASALTSLSKSGVSLNARALSIQDGTLDQLLTVGRLR